MLGALAKGRWPLQLTSFFSFSLLVWMRVVASDLEHFLPRVGESGRVPVADTTHADVGLANT